MKLFSLGGLIGAALMVGCAGRPSLFPNADPNLRRTSAQFAADAAKRHPYKQDLPSGGEALARSSVDYTFKTIDILNYSDEDWNDVEIWVNRNFVCWVPRVEKGKERSKQITFTMLFDDQGNSFDTQNGKLRVEKIEMLRDGKMYNIPVHLAD